MKKISLLLILISISWQTFAQPCCPPPPTLRWRSDFDGWIGNTCDECPTFSNLCVDPSSTYPCPGNAEWYRIGSPDQSGGPGFVGLISDNAETVEGLYTNFNFNSARNYNIHIGVKSTAVLVGGQQILLYGASLLSSDFQWTCNGQCQDEPLESNPSSGTLSPINSSRWQDDPITSTFVPVSIERAGNLNVPYTSSTTDYSTIYTPSTNFSQFAFHTYTPFAYGAYAQYETVVDYAEIDVPCDATFKGTVKLISSGPPTTLGVEFDPNLNFTSGSYTWQISGFSPSTTSGTYLAPPLAPGTYTITLKVADLFGNSCSTSKSITLTSGGTCTGCRIASNNENQTIANTKTQIDGVVISPNPATNLANIQFTLNEPSNVLVKVYDMNGKEMNIGVNQYLQKGDQKLQISTADLAAGLYNVKVLTGKGISTQKLTIVR